MWETTTNILHLFLPQIGCSSCNLFLLSHIPRASKYIWIIVCEDILDEYKYCGSSHYKKTFVPYLSILGHNRTRLYRSYWHKLLYTIIYYSVLTVRDFY